MRKNKGNCKGHCGVVEYEKKIEYAIKFKSERHVKEDIKHWNEHGKYTTIKLEKRVQEYFKA